MISSSGGEGNILEATELETAIRTPPPRDFLSFQCIVNPLGKISPSKMCSDSQVSVMKKQMKLLE